MDEKLSRVPAGPGIYIFKDGQSRVLYIGKAKNLRTRLRSYFQRSAALDERKAAMVRGVADFEYTVTGNELEAFVLEANLIKQHRPRYNILLRDDKSYPYLKLTVNEMWPRLEVVRRIQKDGAKYFGPYVPSGAMWEILSFIRTNFTVRTCKYTLEKRMRPCIQYQIKKCIAPCGGKVDHAEYMGMVNEVKLLLEGRNKGLLDMLEKKMKRLSDEMRYEEASLVRDRIKAIKQISETQKAVAPELGDIDTIGIFREEDRAVLKILFIRNGIMVGSRHFSVGNVSGETDSYILKNFIGQFYGREIIPPPVVLCPSLPDDMPVLTSWLSERRGSSVKIAVPKRGIRRGLVEMAQQNAEVLARSEKEAGWRSALEELATFLMLDKTPVSIGAFDISNISGKEPVGAFVYWADGRFQKDRYRHIKMDAVKGPDDYSMMKEMIRRTVRNMQGEMPDLLIIDGGRAHLDAGLEVFREIGLSGTEAVGLAKDPDRIFIKKIGPPLSLEDGRAPSLLLKRIRDEVHRFAISYHKKLRAGRTFESPLEKIPGVAKKRRFALLRHFGSIEAIRKAPVEEIAAIRGMNMSVAKKIHDSLSERLIP
ncbi:MAG TPA: excinuclease ABC subunit UvrC [Candidatus Sulfobium mesophilum]|nr:excinuclease ABC subunit UvrC [Candidatus Sulfobium mesophilum]